MQTFRLHWFVSVGFISLMAVAWAGQAEHPLIASVASIKNVGPKDEPVAMEDYTQILFVGPFIQPQENRFTDIQKAMEAAAIVAREGQRVALFVASGTYSCSPLRLVRHVDLFGGYDSDYVNRSVCGSESVLQGDGTGPVVIGADDARLDGFRVVNGGGRSGGGGVLCDHTSPILSNNVICYNRTQEPEGFHRDMIHQTGSDGAGIAVVSGARPIIRNNLIYGNTTEIGMGAGLYIWNECAPKVIENVFLSNRGGLGGGQGKEGSRSSNGGAIAISRNCYPEIVGNVIVGNQVADNSDGGGLYLEYDAQARIIGNWIVGNRAADDGGGIYIMKNSEPLLERNVFMGNRNTTDGSGGIRLSKEGRLRANHNLLAMNPGTIDAVNTWMLLTRNTLVGSPNGSIIFENNAAHLMPSRIEGNLVYGSGEKEFFFKQCVTGPPEVRDNLIRGGYEGVGNVVMEPEFLEDGWKGTIRRMSLDESTQTTIVELDTQGLSEDSAGRVLRIGDAWSVVKGAAGDKLIAWGQFPNGAGQVEILATFQPARGESASSRYGAYSEVDR